MHVALYLVAIIFNTALQNEICFIASETEEILTLHTLHSLEHNITDGDERNKLQVLDYHFKYK
jgi:hypothetical protein